MTRNDYLILMLTGYGLALSLLVIASMLFN